MTMLAVELRQKTKKKNKKSAPEKSSVYVVVVLHNCLWVNYVRGSVVRERKRTAPKAQLPGLCIALRMRLQEKKTQKTRVGKDLLSFFVFFRESREKKKKNQDFQDFCLFFSGSLEIFEIFEKS